jgi:hypothetical protein
MTHKIIQTNNYLLVVDDSKIKEGDWLYSISNQLVVQSNKGSADIINSKVTVDVLYLKIIAHLPLNSSPILEGVDLLPPLTDEAKDWARSQWSCEPDDYEELYYDGLEKGYNAAKAKYKYTEKDMREAFKAGQLDKGNNWYGGDFIEFIQSHQQLKIPIGFEFEAKDTYIKNGILVKTEWAGKYIFD